MASITKPAGTYEYQGETKQGYIKDGKTYTDSNYTTEVPVGSKVYTNGGTFIKTGGPSLQVNKPAVTTPVSNATPATYTVNGAVKQGYIKDGQTYTDPGMTQRVPNGAIVNAGGKTYEMTANGGVPTAQTQINDYVATANAQKDAYVAAQKAREQQIKNSVNATINRLNEQKRVAEQQKKEADRVAYNAYLRATNPYGTKAQQMAALGLGDSGFAETNLTSMGNQYQENVTKAMLERDAALREIGYKIEEARLTGDMQLADALTAYAQNIANMNLGIAEGVANISNNAATQAYARTRDLIADEIAAEERAYNKELNNINTVISLLGMGFTPANAAQILNVDPAQVNAIASYYRQILNKQGNISSGSNYSWLDELYEDEPKQSVWGSFLGNLASAQNSNEEELNLNFK